MKSPWVKVSERLPNKKGRYIMRHYNGYDSVIEFDFFKDGKGRFHRSNYFIKDAIKNEWLDESIIIQLSEENEKLQWQYADTLEWLAIFYGALHELVEVKKIKDSAGKNQEYEERQPVAWYSAFQAIELWLKSDYGALELKSVLKEENDKLRANLEMIEKTLATHTAGIENGINQNKH